MVPLPGGRFLAVDDTGDRDGSAVVFLHGTPSSRLARHPDDSIAESLGVRLLSFDRPGIGRSSADPRTTLGSFASDVATALDQLGVDRFAVLAWSAGALWALGIAAHNELAGRLQRVTIVAGLVPAEAFHDPGIRTACGEARRALLEAATELGPDEAAELAAPLLAPYPCTPQLARDHLAANRDATEAAEIASVRGGAQQAVVSLQEAVAQGLDGVIRDLAVQLAPSGVDPAAIDTPVRLLYGELDAVCPPSFGQWLAAQLPNAHLEVRRQAGHGLAYPAWTELLAATAEG